jgi:hypothetical protein
MKTGCAFLAILGALVATCGARDFITANDQARWLAGLPVPEDSPLAACTTLPSWLRHASEMDQAWAQCEDRSLAKARVWSSTFVRSSGSTEPCFYMFSGPDLLYAHTLYPNASSYVLCGIEPVGTVPDLTKLSPELRDASLANIRRSLSTVLKFSYFITKDMRTDLSDAQLGGIVPIVYLFIARMGGEVIGAEYVSLNTTGAMGKGNIPGVRIRFRKGLSEQSVYYFKADLSNGGSGAGVMNFCRSLGGPGLGLLKAASYLLHEEGFSQCREFLLTHCRVLVQDDSGIPHRYFDAAQWQLRYFGNYAGTTGGPFAKYYQADLATAYASVNPPELDFQLSYQWNLGTANALIAVRTARPALKVSPPAIGEGKLRQKTPR